MYEFDVFISYAHKDSAELVTALFDGLTAHGLKIWRDKGQIKLGDSITDKITEGLQRSKYGLVILSPGYAKSAWAKGELKALMKMQFADGRKRVLPVWYKFTHDEIVREFPLYADLKALIVNNANDLEEGIGQIVEVVTGEEPKGDYRAPREIFTRYEEDRVRSHKDEVSDFLDKGDIEATLDYIKQNNVLTGKERDSLSILSARYYGLMREKHTMLVSDENFRLEQARIIAGLRSLIK
ncbi:MAG: toll/interleukin-1 receptor domain-containing protein [Bacteroidia bacterium]|nr:toll/interleukin-1 receptor domain-containing protein [Bacteroidia bacterium]